MDSHEIDKFYSHFPSYSGETSRRKLLDKDRQDEYKHYLSRLASAEKASEKFAISRNVRNELSSRQKVTVAERDEPHSVSNREHDILMHRNCQDMNERDMMRAKYLQNLQNMDLPDIFNDEIIKQRNRRIAEEQQYKKIQYQRELLAQIEQKRYEAELRKAKEIAEDERSTRKMEEQLRSVRLQDEIEKSALAHKRDYTHRMDSSGTNAAKSPKQNKYQMPMSSRSMYKSPRRNHYTDRLAESNHGKENQPAGSKVDDTDIYKYFTNSARDPADERNISFRSHQDLGIDENISNTMESHRCHTYPLKKNRNTDTRHHCERCEIDVNREKCNFCQQNRFLSRSEYGNCVAHDRPTNLCKSCYYQSICACCREQICARCSRPTKRDDNMLKPKAATATKQSPRRRKLSPRTTKLALLEESYEDSSGDDENNFVDRTSSRLSSPKKLQPNGKPYSINIDKSSIFHPSNARLEPQMTASPRIEKFGVEQIDDLKRITEEKLSKYAKNYGDMRTKNAPRSKMIDMDPYPLPLLTHENASRKSIESNANQSTESDNNSFAFRQLEARWQIPFTEKNTVIAPDNDKKMYVLTQSGAFKKQLQLDKFNFDFDRRRSDEDQFVYK